MQFEMLEPAGIGSKISTASVSFKSARRKVSIAKADALLEAHYDLVEARKGAEAASDKLLLYFIDMGIFHISEKLSAILDRALPGSAAAENLPGPPTG